MDLEIKNSAGKQEKIRHWTNKEIGEMHKAKGYNWRNNRTKLRVLPVNDEFRSNYFSVFRHD